MKAVNQIIRLIFFRNALEIIFRRLQVEFIATVASTLQSFYNTSLILYHKFDFSSQEAPTVIF